VGRSPIGNQRGVVANPHRLSLAGSAHQLRTLEDPSTTGIAAGQPDGTWAKVLDELCRDRDQSAQAGHSVEWSVGVDSTVVRAHQHAAGTHHAPPPHLATEDALSTEADIGGWVE
jgi:hypothetical protein